MPAAVVVYSLEDTGPFALIPPAVGLVDSNTGVVLHSLSEYSLERDGPRPGRSDEAAERGGVFDLGADGHRCARGVVIVGSAFSTSELSPVSPQAVATGFELFASP